MSLFIDDVLKRLINEFSTFTNPVKCIEAGFLPYKKDELFFTYIYDCILPYQVDYFIREAGNDNIDFFILNNLLQKSINVPGMFTHVFNILEELDKVCFPSFCQARMEGRITYYIKMLLHKNRSDLIKFLEMKSKRKMNL